MMKNYKVIEDNGGGLTLVVFGADGQVEYLHTGYEYNPGKLTDDLDALEKGDNPIVDWDGNEDDPQRIYDDMISHDCGWEVVADNNGLYPEDMGVAAKLEFKLDN